MRSYGRHALWGIAFVSASIAATQFSNLVAQLALGWLLTRDDYKIWGMLLSLRMFVDGLRDGGVIPLMLQRSSEANDNAALYLKYALVFNLLSAGILTLLIPFAESYYTIDGLTWLIMLMAIGIPLHTPAVIHRARLSGALKFSTIATVASICAVVNYGAMVAFAALGMGPYSFVLPPIVSALLEWRLFGGAAGKILRDVRLTFPAVRGILKGSKWTMVSSAVMSVAMTGDYLVIGLLAPDVLGEYLFGFQLTVAVSTVVVAGFQQVLLPIFSRLRHDRERMAEGYLNSVIVTAFICAPCCAAMSVLAPPVVHLVWGGKWDGAIPVVQVMSLLLVFRLFNPLAASALQAVARWDLFAMAMIVDAVAVVVGAWVGTRVGGLTAIALAVGVSRFLVVPVLGAIAGSAVGVRPTQLLLAIVGRIGLPAAGVCGVWLGFGFPGDLSREYLTKAVLAVVAAEAVTFWLYRSDVQLIRRVLKLRESPQLDESVPTAACPGGKSDW